MRLSRGASLSAVVLAAGIVLGFSGPTDSDGDGVPDSTDCAPDDDTLWAAPGEVTDLAAARTAGITTWSWNPPGNLGGEPGWVTYEVLRSVVATDFESRLGCVEIGDTDASASDAGTPIAGRPEYVLVRVRSCEVGTVGSGAPGGTERVVGPFTTVTNLNDGGPGSLRQAVADASPGDLICVPLTGSLLLTTGEISTDEDLTIRGPGRDVLMIDGNASSTVFDVNAGNLTLADTTVTNAGAGLPAINVEAGATLAVSGASVSDNRDDGITYQGASPTLTVDHSQVSRNDRYGIWAGAAATTITRSSIDGNGFRGAFLFGDASIEQSTIAGNYGTGIWFGGQGNTLTIDSCTISDNNSSGIFSQFGNLAITKTTISGNNGSGVYTYFVSGSIRSSTISDNTGGYYQGGLVTYGDYGDLEVSNTILVGNTDHDCRDTLFYDGEYGTALRSGGHNISGDTSCVPFNEVGDRVGMDPMLLPLASNGGPTMTRALDSSSPALDAGSCPGEPTDQRGLFRPVDLPGVPNAEDACDIGAVEQQVTRTPAF